MKKVISILLSTVLIVGIAFSASAAGNEKKLVVLGDSIAQGFGIRNRDEACYGRIVADTISAEYKNYGVDGQRSWDLIDALKDENMRKDIAEADIISLSIGGNDYLQQNLPKIAIQVMCDNFKILNDIESDFIEYFAEIITTIKTLNPNATLLVQTLYNPRIDFLHDFYGLATERVNRDIYAYLENNPGAFTIVDTIPIMENHPECVAIDTVHPSAVGNEVIAGEIVSVLYSMGLSPVKEPVINVKGIDEIPFLSYILKAIFTFFAGFTAK